MWQIPTTNKTLNLDWMDMDTWTDLENRLGPRTRKFGFKVRTKYGVYSCLSLPFLRIENRAKIKRHVFCSKIWIFREKTLKEWDNPVRKSRLKPQSVEKTKNNPVLRSRLNLKMCKGKPVKTWVGFENVGQTSCF